jgi:hypothetical protein
MTPFLLVSVVLVLFMAKKLTEIYAGEDYRCPSCGARDEDRHSPERGVGSPPVTDQPIRKEVLQ